MYRLARQLLRAAHRALGPFLPPTMLAVRVDGIRGRVHVDDQMLPSFETKSVEHYRRTGEEAVHLVEEACLLAGRRLADLRAVLVLPSGYGRVVRHLRERVPAGRITACDVDWQAARFCAREFGVDALRSDADVRRIALPDRYDLIFVGSLLTHLPVPVGLDLLQVLSAALGPDGLVVFTTQGAGCLEHLSWYGAEFARAEPAFRDRLSRQGACFLPYDGHADYGITLHVVQSLRCALDERLGTRLRLLRVAERAWDAHQDVWMYARRQPS